ncbi:Fanconi anemia group I protein homolog [Phymastichus coffea]|uniref:Fanconi anemia group I protein homolog n=1 Tax=Phymastichus coffea TaxID=108790 RepID=UPI00273C51D3|nr:Fanconi anemia group I protein homolog [Phymastichus coffea]
MSFQSKTISSQRSTQSKSMKTFVEDADAEEICQMLLEILNTSEGIKMLDNLLQAFILTSEIHHDKRIKLVKSVFDALKKPKVTTKHVDEIVNRIVIDFHAFSRGHLTKLVDYCLDRIRTNDDDHMSWKDVLPVLLEKLEDEKSINYRGTDVSGQDYKITILRSICDIDWDTKILTSLAKMFVEILTDVKDKLISVTIMKALTNKLIDIELNELPPLTHQLLKLGPDHNSILLFSTLSRFFAHNYASLSEDNNSEEITENIISSKITLKELQNVESTVLYHIYQSVLDNEKGAKEYMKCLKLIVNAPEYVMKPFVMSVLLLLSDLYEEQAFSILKSAVVRQIQDEEYKNNSAWLRKVLQVELGTFQVISQVIDNSNKNRELVLKGMVNFAFALLGIDKKAGSDSHLPWDYGSKIIQKIAKKRSDATATILEILVSKIVRSGSVTQYTDCLSYLCRRLTMTVLEHQVWITTLLEHILDIRANVAAEILRAILPLMRIFGSIRDNLIMILRKALYRQGVQTRKMAVLGFLQLLKNLKLKTFNALSQPESLSLSNVASSSSLFTQVTLERSSQRVSSNPWHNTNLCREILSILQRCFSHETEVRSHLYRELYYSILKNTELTEYAVEMLLEHFYVFYEKDEQVLPPLNFDKCGAIQGVDIVMQEPLADLIFVLQKIYLKVALKDSATIEKLSVLLESLCDRMIQTDIEHLGLGDEIDLSDNTPKSQQKILNIKLTISIFESLMAFRIMSWSQYSGNIGQSIISLYKGYMRFVEYIKRVGKKKGGKGKKDKDKDKDTNDITLKKSGRPTTLKLPNTVMDFDTLSKSIVLLYDPSNQWVSEEQTDCLRGRIEFHQYILQTCLQLFHNVKVLKENELKNYLELNKKNFFTIGETLYNRIVSDLKTVNAFNPTVAGLGVECFKECCEVMCTLYSTELPVFLELTCGAKSSDSLSLKIQSLIMPLKDIFIENLTREEEEPEEVPAQTIPGHLIDIVSNLVKKIIFNEVKHEDVFDWMSKVAEEYENLDVQVSSKIIQLILLVEERSLEYGETVQDVCLEFCAILGKIDKTEITTTRKFQIINEDNVYIAYIAVNKMLTLKMQNLIWILGTLNSEHIAMNSIEINSEANRKQIKDKEQSLCRQFGFILRAFEVLANVKIEPGQASDSTFKNIQKVYNFACSLTKYFKKKSTPENPSFQSVKFVSIIHGAGNALKHAVMNLIVHVEANQSGGKSNDALLQRNKILKETMVIPGVVQAIDNFDKEIVLLSKKTNLDLIKFTKFDAIRDFRIEHTQFLNNLEKMNVSLMVTQNNHINESNEESNDESDNNSESDGSPKAKRHCN